MNTKTKADYVDGAHVLPSQELMQVHGGQEEVRARQAREGDVASAT